MNKAINPPLYFDYREFKKIHTGGRLDPEPWRRHHGGRILLSSNGHEYRTNKGSGKTGSSYLFDAGPHIDIYAASRVSVKPAPLRKDE